MTGHKMTGADRGGGGGGIGWQVRNKSTREQQQADISNQQVAALVSMLGYAVLV